MNKLDLETVNLKDENIKKIEELFPNVVTEGENGKVVDFDLLKQELSDQVVEGNKESYQLTWPGKNKAILTANNPTTKTLRPLREKSVNFDTTENVYIEGDNLEVLKILQESYLNKIKMIYIDPPYNTGKDFIYRDNFKKGSEEELLESGQVDEYGNNLVVNPDTSGKYHSDWLSMMYPRLKLARNLLMEDGVIFISIDDNEVDNLKKICNVIFGERNFSGKFIWKKKQGGGNDSNILVVEHEYIIAYCKNIEIFKFNLDKNYHLDDALYPNKDENGEYGLITLDKSSIRFSESLVFEIKDSEGNSYFPRVVKGKQSCWRWGRKKVEECYDELVFKNGKVYTKYYRPKGVTPKSLLIDTIYGRTESGNDDIKKVFDNKNPFSYPKPIALVKHLLSIGTHENDIVLDFFSGSATTAHAVMKLNAEDAGNRKFIMVQVPEKIDEKNKESQEFCLGNNLESTICSIGQERIRRAAKQIKEETNVDIDYGFRVYKVDSSNMKDVYFTPNEVNQLQLGQLESNIKEDRSREDLLISVLLDLGLCLDLKIESKEILGCDVMFVEDNSLIACFDLGVKLEVVDEICKYKPLKLVFRESCFLSDSDKINVAERVKKLSPITEIHVL